MESKFSTDLMRMDLKYWFILTDALAAPSTWMYTAFEKTTADHMNKSKKKHKNNHYS